MSKMGWIVLAAVMAGIGGALYVELKCDVGALGSILILGITALVVVWYADETRRLAVSSCRPELVMYRPEYQPSEREQRIRAAQPHTRPSARERARVINRGAGPAFDVSMQIGAKKPLNIAQVLPREGLASDDCLTQAEASGGIVTLSYKDGAGNRYETWWTYDKDIRNWRVAKPCEIVQ